MKFIIVSIAMILSSCLTNTSSSTEKKQSTIGKYCSPFKNCETDYMIKIDSNTIMSVFDSNEAVSYFARGDDEIWRFNGKQKDGKLVEGVSPFKYLKISKDTVKAIAWVTNCEKPKCYSELEFFYILK